MPGAADISSSPAAGGHGQTVCVTGAGGFIASWIVKLLLARGYTVRGTVRNPEDPKNDHLRELEGAKERLTLWEADLLDFHSLRAAIAGCHGVFHAACPITDDPAKVRRVVFTSSVGAVYMDPNRSHDVVMDESYWSDLEYCKDTKVLLFINFSLHFFSSLVELSTSTYIVTKENVTIYEFFFSFSNI
ncbi:unnamed protein product [Linum tenue]|uniref:NAD-dependent epimerase/dehydratase domain-containing protein n=1 Tax=Linum tenue TaxID=586396 RepID=A0AAV0KCT3_9ROSI|nr:unnamed protein product [Linum tenue]